jgi:hypothetical protein
MRPTSKAGTSPSPYMGCVANYQYRVPRSVPPHYPLRGAEPSAEPAFPRYFVTIYRLSRRSLDTLCIKETTIFKNRRDHRASECRRFNSGGGIEGERRHAVALREQNRQAWQSFYLRLADSLRASADLYDRKAEALRKQKGIDA